MLIFIIVVLWVIGFFASYMLMSLRRKMLSLTYGPYECDPTLLVSAVLPPLGIVFALADIAAYKMGLRLPGYYFNGNRCSLPR